VTAPNVDPLMVALIRTLNANYPGVAQMTDLDLVQTFGAAAQPLADGLRAAIREEVQRQRDDDETAAHYADRERSARAAGRSLRGVPPVTVLDQANVSDWWRCPRCGTFPETMDGGAAFPGRVVCAPHLSALPAERGQACAGAGMLAVKR
jgi:hypothetical protein